MALLVDKYRPRTLDALTYHGDLSERLRILVSGDLVLNVVTIEVLDRHKVETFHISSCTDLAEQAKSLVS